MKGLIKKLNKPEMLLLNHLQNQIKQYYPEQMNKHLALPEEYGLLSVSKKEDNDKQKSGKPVNKKDFQRRQSEQTYQSNLTNSLNSKNLLKFMDTSPENFGKSRKSNSNKKA